jgi:hypothetical protein
MNDYSAQQTPEEAARTFWDMASSPNTLTFVTFGCFTVAGKLCDECSKLHTVVSCNVYPTQIEHTITDVDDLANMIAALCEISGEISAMLN